MVYQRVPVVNSHSVLRALMRLAERKHGLASTLVQQIPMKEEANADSVSTMYGVELLHESRAHDLLRRLGLAERLYLRQEGDKTKFLEPSSGFSKTLGIRWISPRPVDNCRFLNPFIFLILRIVITLFINAAASDFPN